MESIFTNVSLDDLLDKVRAVIREEVAGLQSNSSSSNEDRYLTRIETAQKLRVSLRTLDQRVKHGDIPVRRVGNRVLFRAAEITRLLSKTN